ncbi:cytochrome c [Bradyrhizobium brasilense]|uniref:cytochrome c n=1 Tax=Bradyrhizobium brasilense TaxID=1419277 RepID=UPI00287747C4|nr:cytochrome c [Bradyrhizobium brasilense]MCP3415710.1 cytochrome c [Bradyrhizobium brasilense]
MKTILIMVLTLAILGLVAIALIVLVPNRRTSALQRVADDFTPAAGHGEYVARLANCAACHTVEGGKPFAGGLAIPGPFGTIWSTNITADPVTGIGSYTLDDFRAVLYDGLRKDGVHLYPAMPYENYRKISEEDVRALYHYFMDEVEPVTSPAKQTRLSFPFNQRWGVRVWNWLALNEPGFKPRYDDLALDRGAYIVETLSHCGACHSPRKLFFAQDGTDATAQAFLTGGEIDGRPAPSLRDPKSVTTTWSAEELKAFLATGRNNHSAVTGEMALVVQESMQYLTGKDLDAVVAYLREISCAAEQLPVRNDEKSKQTIALLNSADPSMDLGPRLYLDNCNGCHFTNGKGAQGVFPELDDNPIVVARQSSGLIDVILNGARVPSTERHPMRLAMPGFSERLSDKEIAHLATFLRQSWSNNAGPVEEIEVVARRQKLAAH